MESLLMGILGPAFTMLVLAAVAFAFIWWIAGPQLAFAFAGKCIRGVTWVLKIVFMTLSFVFRRFFFMSKEYVKDDKNQNAVWNATGAAVGIATILYLIGSFRTIYEVYTWQDDGWLILGFIGLASIRGSFIISNAPFMKATKFTKEWASVLAEGLCGLAFASAIVNLELYFFHEQFPKISLIAALIIYLAFLSYIAVKLTEGAGGTSVLDQFEDAQNRAGEGGSIIRQREKADMHVANTKPNLTKPKSEPMIIPEVSRYQHMQVIGPTGTGKSILLNNMATQDILDPGTGLVVLEPTKDVVWGLRAICRKVGRKFFFIDPTDPKSDIINPLDGTDIDKICVMNARAFSGYLGNNANQFYKEEQENALMMAIKVAKAVKGDEATYEDLREIVRPINKALRQQYLKQIADPDIRNDLAEFAEMFEDPKMAPEARRNYQGLNTYLKKLTGNKHMRRMLCSKSTLKLKDVFDNGHVLLITTDYPELLDLGFVLGRLMINMLQTETFNRAGIPDSIRDTLPPMAVYVDEVQNYVSEPFAEIFEMARKAKMMMHIFHQGLAQLRKISERLEESIFDNARQKVIFGGTNIKDCEMFSEKIGQFWENITTNSQAVFNPLQINTMKREELRMRMRPDQIHKLPGFNTKTFDPAEVLCLFVINNVIEDEQIGLIGPLPKHIFRDSEEMTKAIIDNQAAAASIAEVAAANDSPSDENENVNYTYTDNDDEVDKDGENEGEVIEDAQEESTQQQGGKRRRRKRGASKTPDNGAAVEDENTLALNDMHEQQNNHADQDKGLSDDEMLLLMHDDDK
ncbi:TraM recognition domain-containing protein [Cohnella sp. CFH 77786]|uniref:TraM recognition domain-containing protein n=1 Tax=Cohnella sp. CFH 77786 TaxID=2662265 RepID=UPI001C60D5C6|nr:TraM recognition domain-containing protein [Cohnella sp. CFH 77786]MBW5449361.1 TraM recognition domain-containing protein [Cohnella sp. CFH 77786]